MKKRVIKYWLVSAVNALAGTLCVLPFNGEKYLIEHQQLCRLLNEKNHSERWTICTNECATTFPEQGMRFSDGKFVKL